MVNTFITDTDFAKSAKNLDKRRLNKQIVEAYQILNILESIQTIVKYFKFTIPYKFTNASNDFRFSPAKIIDRYLERLQWYKNAIQQYKNQDVYLAYIDKTLVVIPKTKKYIVVKKNFIIDKKSIIVTTKQTTTRYARKDVLLPGDRVLKLGFCHHPIVKMWLGYKNALREYINIHIDEYCCNRYNKNGKLGKTSIKKYTIQKAVVYPWWCQTYVINSHKASLLRKSEKHEIDAKWYNSIPSIKKMACTVWYTRGYSWSCNLDRNIMISIVQGKKLYIKNVTLDL